MHDIDEDFIYNIDLEKVRAVKFTPEAVEQCRNIIKADPGELDTVRFFAELQCFYERQDIVGAFLFSEVWFNFHRKNLFQMMEFLEANKEREDYAQLLNWFKDSLLASDSRNDDDVRTWEAAASQWVASYSILDELVEELEK